MVVSAATALPNVPRHAAQKEKGAEPGQEDVHGRHMDRCGLQRNGHGVVIPPVAADVYGRGVGQQCIRGQSQHPHDDIGSGVELVHHCVQTTPATATVVLHGQYGVSDESPAVVK